MNKLKLKLYAALLTILVGLMLSSCTAKADTKVAELSPNSGSSKSPTETGSPSKIIDYINFDSKSNVKAPKRIVTDPIILDEGDLGDNCTVYIKKVKNFSNSESGWNWSFVSQTFDVNDEIPDDNCANTDPVSDEEFLKFIEYKLQHSSGNSTSEIDSLAINVFLVESLKNTVSKTVRHEASIDPKRIIRHHEVDGEKLKGPIQQALINSNFVTDLCATLVKYDRKCISGIPGQTIVFRDKFSNLGDVIAEEDAGIGDWSSFTFEIAPL